jgi:hypothetical protein
VKAVAKGKGKEGKGKQTLTQHPHQPFDKRTRFPIPHQPQQKFRINEIIPPEVLLWDLLTGIQILEPHVLGQEVGLGDLVEHDVESVEAGGAGVEFGGFEEPDTR